jgi:hypothetical protein
MQFGQAQAFRWRGEQLEVPGNRAVGHTVEMNDRQS